MSTTIEGVVNLGPYVGPVVAGALTSAGMSTDAVSRVISSSGRFDPEQLAREAVGTVQIRTRFLPPITATVAGEPTPWTDEEWQALTFVQPAVEVNSPFGTYVYAPAGDPGPTVWKKNALWGLLGIGAIGGLIVIGLLRAGRAIERRRERG